MGKWNDFPFEIKRDILLNLVKKDKKTLCNCLLVNKEFLATCQPILYQDISLNMELEDKIFKASQISTCKAGQWVKKVNMKTLVAINDADSPGGEDKNQEEALCTFIRMCPNAEEVDFPADCDEDQWLYFFNANDALSIWNLRSIPKQYFGYVIDEYIMVAQLMADQLTRVTLNHKEFDYKILKDFKCLTSIDIGLNLVKNMLECSDIIQFAPLLDHLKVDFKWLITATNIQEAVIANSKWDDVQIMRNIEPFSKIKNLYCHNFNPSNDQELLFVADKFDGVVNLSMEFNPVDFRPAKKIGSAAMDYFFKYVQKIPEYLL